MKVAIPSKGRPGKITSLDIFPKAYIFVEPQDFEEYNKLYSRVINIKENDKGVSYVRNFILKYFEKEKIIAIADDDITQMYKANTLLIKEQVEEQLKLMEDTMIRYDIAQVGVNTKSLAGLTNKTIDTKGKIINFTLLNIPLLEKHKIKYDYNLTLFEDVDLSISLLRVKLKILKYCKYGIDTYSYKNLDDTGRGTFWNTKNIKKNVDYILEKHKGLVSFRKDKKRRPNFTVHWRRL